MVRALPDAASRRSSGQCERETGRQRRGTWQLRSQIRSCPSQALRRRPTIPVEPILSLAPVDSRPTSHLAHCSPRGTPLDRDPARLAATDGHGISSCRYPTVFRPMRARDRQTAPSALACPFADPFMSEQSPATTPRIPFKPILPLAPVDSGTTRHLAHCSPRGTPLEPGPCEAGSNRWSGHLLMLPPPTVFRPMRARDRQTAPSALARPFADPLISEPSPATRLNQPACTNPPSPKAPTALSLTTSALREKPSHACPAREGLWVTPPPSRLARAAAKADALTQAAAAATPSTRKSRCRHDHRRSPAMAPRFR